jgi:hypothetical protein
VTAVSAGLSSSVPVADGTPLPPGPQLPRLRSIARHAVPNLVECTLIPTLIFSFGLQIYGFVPASIAALTWAYAMLARRLMRRERIPGLLMLTTLGLSVRTAVAVASGSAFIYFLQPITATAAVGLTFLVTSVTRNPLVDRLAKDFCPLDAETAARPGVKRLFRRLTVLWAGVTLVNASVTGWLLLTQPVSVFVALKPLAALVVTWAGVVATVAWALRVARAEGLRPARRLA